MKKKVIIYYPKQKSPVLEASLRANIREIFGDRLDVSEVHAGDLAPGTRLDTDLILLLTMDNINDITNFSTDFSSSLTVARSITKAQLPQILAIPNGTRVLVVNDTLPMVTELQNNLLSLGFTNVTWVPLREEEEKSGAYRNIRYAICPNEKELVPPYIPNVIDIGERWIDSHTMLRICSKLHIQDTETQRRLLNYCRKLAEPDSSVAISFFGNYLKNTILQDHIEYSQEGILLCDDRYRCLYANELWKKLYPALSGEDTVLSSILPQLCDESRPNGMLQYEGSGYLFYREACYLEDTFAGYCITLQDERSIRSLNTELGERLSKSGLEARYRFSDILHHSAIMADTIRRARQAAATDYPVLIQGESGTGKELFAQSIHNAGSRSSMPFVAVNCAAFTPTLLESELFGYEGGSFTGARRQGKAGLMERANGGTLFLDEIGDMPLSLQVMLLRALQEKQIRRVGGDTAIDVNVRVIGATNKRLYTEIQEGRFRSDLYYRLNTLPLSSPPLRKRPEDILLLLKSFLGDSVFARLSSEDRRFLQRQPWPGNIRQLENFAHYYMTTHDVDGFFQPEELAADDANGSALKQISVSAAEPVLSRSIAIPSQQHILQLISGGTSPRHGVGREALLETLHREGSGCSSAWLRDMLDVLRQQGLIEIGRGRAGCTLTDKGWQAVEAKK